MRTTLRCMAALCLMMAAAPAAEAQYAPVYDLTSLNGSNGFRYSGLQLNGQAGFAVSAVGDVNGDGFADTAIASPGAKSGSFTEAGEIAVIFGRSRAHPATLDAAALDGKTGFRVVGFASGMTVGTSVAAAGDMNGDGFGDMVIGASYANAGGKTGNGRAFIVFGQASGFPAVVHLDDFDGLKGVKFQGIRTNDRLGEAVAGAGDINGDGYSDVLVGAPGFDTGPAMTNAGAVFVIYGRRSGFPAEMPLDLLGSNGVSRVNGGVAEGNLGKTIAGVGDLNGDGLDDFAAGAPMAKYGGEERAGAISVIYGQRARLDAVTGVSTLNGINGFNVLNTAKYEDFGNSLAAAGDVNGDGYADLVAGSTGYGDASKPEAGAAYVLFGNPSYLASNFLADLPPAGLARRFAGFEAGSYVGSAVAGGGDVNGDGFADILIGARFQNFDASHPDTGAAFLVFGAAGGYPNGIALSNLNGVTGVRFNGLSNSSSAGFSAAILGDMNRDGLAELAVGAPWEASGGRFRSGAAFVVRGLGPQAAVGRTGWDDDATILGGPAADSLSGGAGNDVLEGRGGGDELNGGGGGNTASYEHARGPVTASLANPASNAGEAAGDRYSYIVGLRGSWYGDRLIGDAGPNGIAGLRGRDVMSGGGGATTYFYYDVRESRPGSSYRDVITDFNPGTVITAVDRIYLLPVDAMAGVDGRQRFKWIGTKPFSRHKGELRVGMVDGQVLAQADVTGDGRADFEIRFANLKTTKNLDRSDFVLVEG